ncbi:hypothetical protein MKZ38_007832 [Zalerion maritima]|uniref:Uncharacterized protein n=1 Tax=Zalerion maritima TaxID=339359 RepID=A0AAD5RI78_9PEZI|nr:hypothetical protein MKZ38_007832 [Zalerion maritima]
MVSPVDVQGKAEAQQRLISELRRVLQDRDDHIIQHSSEFVYLVSVFQETVANIPGSHQVEINADSTCERIAKRDIELRDTRKELEEKRQEARSLSHAADTLWHRIQALEDKLNDSETRNQHLSDKCAYLEQKVADQNLELEAVRREARNAVSSMIAGPQVTTNRISDSEITLKWNSLAYSVQCLAALCNFRPTNNTALFTDQSLRLYVQHHHPHLHILLSPLLIMKFVESCVWFKLVDFVFCPLASAWAGSHGRKFLKMWTRMMDKSPKDLTLDPEHYAWRAQTAAHLAKNTSHSLRRRELGIATAISTMFSGLIEDRELPNLKSQLLEVVSEAIELDLMFRQSKAAFSAHFCNPYYQYGSFSPPLDENVMDCTNSENLANGSCKTPQVDLIISPMLIKQGTSNGEKYNRESVLIKLKVLCDIYPAQQPNKRGRPANVKHKQEGQSPKRGKIFKGITPNPRRPVERGQEEDYEPKYSSFGKDRTSSGSFQPGNQAKNEMRDSR